MSPLMEAIAVYSAQVAAVVAAATLAAWVARVRLPLARLWLWRVTGAVCLALPFAAVPPAPLPIEVTFGQVEAVVDLARPLTPSSDLGPLVLAVLGAGVAWRALRLGVGFLRLRRLRRNSTPAVIDDAAESLRAAVAPRAELRWTEDLAQPVAFGLRRPLVLLPRSVATLSPEARSGVLCHELVHIARRDWPWMVAEDAVRAVMWFNPAVWWLLDQLHVSREQVVDAVAVRCTGARKPYMQALLWFAESPAAPLPATAFLHRRHLRSRMQHLAQEPHMSPIRLVVTAVAVLALLAGATRAVVAALPLSLDGVGSLAQGPQAQLEIRLAEWMPASGFTAATVDRTKQAIYLEALALVTAQDVSSARVVPGPGGLFSVDLTFQAEASARMSRATAGHVGKPVAIVLDGRVVSAPVVRSPIGRSALLTGSFTRAQADAIVNRLPPRVIGMRLKPTPWMAAFGRASTDAGQDRPFSSKDEGVTLPSVVSETKPVYTQAAKEAKIQGDVLMNVVVKTDGTVGEVAVTKSLDAKYGLDQAAVDAARLWKFKPGTKGGKAVPVEVQLQMRFTLK
jgi:TonB family protein